MLGNLPKAEEHLAALERICLLPCEQYNGLRRAIEKYRRPDRLITTGPTF
jgi:hypothetical protein